MQMSHTEFDPFNHGSTGTAYSIVEDALHRELMRIADAGWSLKGIEKIEQSCAGAEKNSNNYRVVSDSGVFLLKHSHINDTVQQDLVNRCLSYCRENKVPSAKIVPAANGKSYFVHDGEIYCLYDFIEGENFDGSRAELKEVASTLAEFHRVLEKIPYRDEIKSLKGKMERHDRGEVKKIINMIKSDSGDSDFDVQTAGIIDEINAASEEIAAVELEKLPFQIIHYDVHPHNLLFEKDGGRLLAYVDFDPMLYSQRVRDVGLAMHRMARTYGERTERKNDVGADIRKRAGVFLETYLQGNALEENELENISLIIRDEALGRTMKILGNHYLGNNTAWDFDLGKQITLLRESSFLGKDDVLG